MRLHGEPARADRPVSGLHQDRCDINILYREREIAHIVGDAEPRELIDVPVAMSDLDTRPPCDLDGGTPPAMRVSHEGGMRVHQRADVGRER